MALSYSGTMDFWDLQASPQADGGVPALSLVLRARKANALVASGVLVPYDNLVAEQAAKLWSSHVAVLPAKNGPVAERWIPMPGCQMQTTIVKSAQGHESKQKQHKKTEVFPCQSNLHKAHKKNYKEENHHPPSSGVKLTPFKGPRQAPDADYRHPRWQMPGRPQCPRHDIGASPFNWRRETRVQHSQILVQPPIVCKLPPSGCRPMAPTLRNEAGITQPRNRLTSPTV